MKPRPLFVLAIMFSSAVVPSLAAGQSQISDQGFETTLTYTGSPVVTGSFGSVAARVTNRTGAPQSQAFFIASSRIFLLPATDPLSAVDMSNVGAGSWSCEQLISTGARCTYQGPPVADGANFPTLSFNLHAPIDGETPSGNTTQEGFSAFFAGCLAESMCMRATGITGFPGATSGPLSMVDVPIDAPVALLYSFFPRAVGFAVGGSPGQDVLAS